MRSLWGKIKHLLARMIVRLSRPVLHEITDSINNTSGKIDKKVDAIFFLLQKREWLEAIHAVQQQLDSITTTTHKLQSIVENNTTMTAIQTIQQQLDEILRLQAGVENDAIMQTVHAIQQQLNAISATQQRLQSVFEDKKALEQLTSTICTESSKTHRHIDFVQRDILIALQNTLNFIPEHTLILTAESRIASDSFDHISPLGTANDNTRFPRFIRKCETLFAEKKKLSFLDLGCSGGGMVLDALLRGHFAIGLEGSDYSLIQQRAEWRLLKDNLYTCDITKKFLLHEQGKQKPYLFDIITAWEVLEHLPESSLHSFFTNLKTHLTSDGLFIASIAAWDDIDPVTGNNWHVTVRPHAWWKNTLEKNGFVVHDNMLTYADLARGGYNPPTCYDSPYPELPNAEFNFFVVCSAKTAPSIKNSN